MFSESPAAARLITIIQGAWQTHAVAAVAELGVADLLTEGPRPVTELAEEVGADPAAFGRLIRASCAIGLLAEEPPGRVRLTEMGGLLRRAPGSLRDFALVQARPAHLRPYELLAEAVREGRTTDTAALGEPVWEYYGKRPQEAALLGSAIDGVAAIEAPSVVDAVDLTGCRVIVELRGGVSAILAALLEAAPQARGVLADRPELLEASRRRIDEQVLARVDMRPGEPFDPPPDGADLYLISHALHFLDDDGARKMLVRLRNLSDRRAQLVITDPVLTEDSPAIYHLLDLNSLVLLGGRERTRADFEALLAEAGWQLDRIVPTDALAAALLAHKA